MIKKDPVEVEKKEELREEVNPENIMSVDMPVDIKIQRREESSVDSRQAISAVDS